MLKENIILEVADKGIGIPEKELKNIFNRFYRVKGNSEFEARGSGLGLTLVKHAVQAHDWKITVKSKVKEGTTFTIFIPFNPKKEEK
jgi:signal transduction histidine kinase